MKNLPKILISWFFILFVFSSVAEAAVSANGTQIVSNNPSITQTSVQQQNSADSAALGAGATLLIFGLLTLGYFIFLAAGDFKAIAFIVFFILIFSFLLTDNYLIALTYTVLAPAVYFLIHYFTIASEVRPQNIKELIKNGFGCKKIFGLKVI